MPIKRPLISSRDTPLAAINGNGSAQVSGRENTLAKFFIVAGDNAHGWRGIKVEGTGERYDYRPEGWMGQAGINRDYGKSSGGWSRRRTDILVNKS